MEVEHPIDSQIDNDGGFYVDDTPLGDLNNDAYTPTSDANKSKTASLRGVKRVSPRAAKAGKMKLIVLAALQ